MPAMDNNPMVQSRVTCLHRRKNRRSERSEPKIRQQIVVNSSEKDPSSYLIVLEDAAANFRFLDGGAGTYVYTSVFPKHASQ